MGGLVALALALCLVFSLIGGPNQIGVMAGGKGKKGKGGNIIISTSGGGGGGSYGYPVPIPIPINCDGGRGGDGARWQRRR